MLNSHTIGTTPSPVHSSVAISKILGASFIGERDLTPDEIEGLQQESRTLKTRRNRFGIAALCIFISPFLLGMVCGSVFPEGINPQYDHITDILVGIFIVILGLAFVPWMIYQEANERGAEGIDWELEVRRVQQFRGRLDDFKDHKLAESLGSYGKDNPGELLIEVLPYARRLWKIEGRLIEPWKVINKAPKLLAPPRIDLINFFDLYSYQPLPGKWPLVSKGERALTGQENAELSQIYQWQRRFRFRVFRSLSVALLVVAVIALVRLLNHEAQLFGFDTVLILGGTLLNSLFSFLGYHPDRVKKIGQDVTANRVRIMQLQTSAANTVIEVLPHTNRIWTLDGKAAKWRKMRS